MLKMHTSVEKVTPKQAEVWLGSMFEKQRPLRSWWVSFLANEMKKDSFSPTSTIAFAHQNGSSVIVNGQHTLQAIVESRKTQELPVIRYTLDSQEQLNELYAHYDIGLTRTFADSVRVYGVAEKIGVTNTDINKIAAAVRHMEAKFPRARDGRMRFSNEELIDMVYDWSTEYKVLLDTISPCDLWVRNRILSRTIAPVAFVTLRYQQEKAVAFWDQVAKDDGIKRGDPRKALNSKLLAISTANSVTGGVYSSVLLLDASVQSKIAAHCWNKFYRGQSLVMVREQSLEKQDGITIDGTPYK